MLFKEASELAASGGDIDLSLLAIDGFISKKVYRDTAPNGGVLIGFNYTTKSLNGVHDIMDFVQPI